MRNALLVLLSLGYLLSPTSTQAQEECIKPGISFEALTEVLEKDQQLSSMKPWSLQSIVLPECVEDTKLFDLSLTYWTAPSSLKLRYQVVMNVAYDVEKAKTVSSEPSLSKQRGIIDASIRAAEKDALVAAMIKSAPSVAAVASLDARIEYTVPEWGKAAAGRWNGESLERIRLPIAATPKHTQVEAFKLLQPEMLEDKSCDAPDFYEVWQDPTDYSWRFEFTLSGDCAGKWQLTMGLDGSLEAKKL
ncbi:MAG: hypothetical protein RBU37_20920 [Myxococcota bacterium]|jgi:hypothetical protein|nr:hypothetical protein [Myxococcota bacterium]